MPSKFWADVEESSNESNGTATPENETTREATATRSHHQHWANVESSSDEEQRRVVRTAKDKHWDALRSILQKASNSQRTADYTQLSSDFDLLVKSFQKYKVTVLKEGTPNFFVRWICQLREFADEKFNDKINYKKLSHAKATSLAAMRSKLQKATLEWNNDYPDWESKFESCKQNAELFQSESSDSSHSEEEDSVNTDSDVSVKSHEDDGTTDSEEDDGDGWSPSDEEDSSSSDRDDDSSSSESSESSRLSQSAEEAENLEFEDRHQRALRKWGLKPADSEGPKKAPAKTVGVNKEKPQRTQQLKKEKKEITQQPEKASLMVHISESHGACNAEILTKALADIMSQRGKKAADRVEMIRNLQQLVDAASAAGPQSVMEIMGHLVSGYFDYSHGPFSALPASQWIQAHKNVEQIFNLLSRHPNLAFHSVTLTADEPLPSETQHRGPVDSGDSSNAGGLPSSDQYRTSIMLGAFVQRLDDELSKALQFVELNSEEHTERLASRIDMAALLWRAHLYFSHTRFTSLASAMALRLIEHTYYHPVALGEALWNCIREKLPEELRDSISSAVTPTARFDYLIRYVCSHCNNPKEVIRAVLCHVFYLALLEEFHQAKSILQLAGLQEFAVQCEISTHILYNRAVAQLGICAFKLGYIQEAHTWLSELCGMNRHKELLAQGVSNLKSHDKTSEQEKDEKRRQLPHHMHMSLEMIECVHYISAMLLEIPNMAARPLDHHRHIISKSFRRFLDYYDKQPIMCPPETGRDNIVAASRDLQKGDAAGCCAHLFNMRIWEHLSNQEKVKSIIEERVKTEALRTFIFTYSYLYNSFSATRLADMFKVDNGTIHAVVSKMLIKNELCALWDESSECIIINRQEPGPLQVMASQLSDKIIQVLDQNEMLLNGKNPRFTMQSDLRSTRRFENNDRSDRPNDRKPLNRPVDAFHSGGISRGSHTMQRNSRPAGTTFRGRIRIA